MLTSITKQQWDQLNRELNILRDYSKALEAQNATRNEERLILEKQIDRLSQFEKIVKDKKLFNKDQSASTPLQVSNNGPCLDCMKYKSEIMKSQNTIERLRRQNTNLQSSYNVLSETLTKYNSSVNINMHNSYAKGSVDESDLCQSNITLGPNKLHVNNSETEKKHKEVLIKYEQLKVEHQSLKRNIEQLSKSNFQKQQQLITKLESQKQSLNIRISTLQLQIHTLKSTISTKDNQIFTYKNKQSLMYSSFTNLQSQMKAIKQNLANKQKQLIGYKERINGMLGIDSELQHVKVLLVNKEAEINNSKAQLRKVEAFQAKISELELQIRNLKFEVNTKDGQLMVLRNKIQLFTNDLSKNSSLELQLRSTKVSLSNKDSEINNLRSQLAQLSSLRSQVSQVPYLLSQLSRLEKQVKSWQLRYEDRERNFKESHQSQKTSSGTISQYSEQIYKLNNQVVKLQSELREKQSYIVRIQDQLKQRIKKNEQNNAQLKKYDKIVESYLERIGQLQIQLQKLDNSSIRSSNQIPNKEQFNMLLQENHVLNEKIQDLERRISILEGANLSLREELRISIDMRARQTSRLIVSPPTPVPSPNVQDQQLINTIKILKMQLDDIRGVNNKLRAENEYLQAKLSSCELQIENLTNITKMAPIRLSNEKSREREKQFNIIKTNQILANVPMIETTQVYASQIKNESSINPKFSGQIRGYQGYSVYGNSQKDSHLSVKNSVNTPSKVGQSKQRLKWKSREKRTNINPIHNKTEKIVEITNISDGQHIMMMKGAEQKEYQDLQRKIQMLKHENKGLRKHLFNGKN